MRAAASVEENLQQACLVDGAKVKILDWGDM